jgi:hypothetical protein
MDNTNGYDKVEWGAKLNEVEEKYGKLELWKNVSNGDNGLIYYSQEKPENHMKSRRFGFYDEGLQSVCLEIDKFVDEVIKKMESKFGKFIKETEEKRHSLGFAGSLSNKVSDNLYIELFIRIAWDHREIAIYYSNPQWETKLNGRTIATELIENIKGISEINKMSL